MSSRAVVALAAALSAVAPAPAIAAVPADWWHGANLTAFERDGLSSAAAAESLQALRATGANAVAIVVTWYMHDRRSSIVTPDTARTPSSDSVREAILQARRSGMRVLLKPQVDVLDGTFRGDIAPASRASWFESYRSMVGHYARLARETRVDELAVGVELRSLVHDPAFLDVIATARAHFSGRLTYAANWDEVDEVPFWDRLDDIGLDAYFPLAAEPGADVATLLAGWQRPLATIRAVSTSAGRPVLVTELGYAQRADAAVTPWAPQGAPDPQAQAEAYEAALRALTGEPRVRGVLWWDWPADPSGGPGAFSPRGAGAETVLRNWNGGRVPAQPLRRSGLSVPWPLVLLAAASLLAYIFVLALMRASAAADREMDAALQRQLAHGERLPVLPEARSLALRVRRASTRWPLTELDPIERATFAGAVAQAHDFADLDLHWQELIIAAERGPREGVRTVYALEPRLPGENQD